MAEKQYTGHIQEFVPSMSDWSIYKKRLHNYFTANSISEDDQKRAILLSLLNEESYKLLFNMCIPVEPEMKSYANIIKLMDEHFKPVISVFSCLEKFFEARKMPNESPKEWAAHLRSLVSMCNFGGAVEIERALVDRFIIGYDKGSVKDRLFEEKSDVSFSSVVELASSKSVSKPFCSAVKSETEIYYASSRNRAHARPSTSKSTVFRSSSSSTSSGGHNVKQKQRSQPTPTGVTSTQSRCAVCGRRNHQSDKCSFRDCYCHSCNKKGHLAPMCPNKNNINRTTVSYEAPFGTKVCVQI